jgi:hypothetical protein
MITIFRHVLVHVIEGAAYVTVVQFAIAVNDNSDSGNALRNR